VKVRNWRWRRDLPTLALIALLILIVVLANSLGAGNSGHGILRLVPDGPWLCFDNALPVPHVGSNGNDHVCSEAELTQSWGPGPWRTPPPLVGSAPMIPY
jgi:hypothetical protein